MRKIPKKNYYILLVLLLVTVFLTLSLYYLHKNKEKTISSFYEYSNKITSKEFDEYMNENSDLIIYISDKYDLSNEYFENKFEEKLNSLNLKDRLVFIDKKEINKDFTKKLKDKYSISLELEKSPIIIVIVDKKVIKTIYVESNFDVDSIIEYEVFE